MKRELRVKGLSFAQIHGGFFIDEEFELRREIKRFFMCDTLEFAMRDIPEITVEVHYPRACKDMIIITMHASGPHAVLYAELRVRRILADLMETVQ